jgi:hypothetical protein
MLKKVANFYNNMEGGILKEQRGMLLDSLVAFEDVVSKPGGKKDGQQITWGNPSECETYVERLHKATEKVRMDDEKDCLSELQETRFTNTPTPTRRSSRTRTPSSARSTTVLRRRL